jgi:hypothetical protein
MIAVDVVRNVNICVRDEVTVAVDVVVLVVMEVEVWLKSIVDHTVDVCGTVEVE